jgi:hypothetical protein
MNSSMLTLTNVAQFFVNKTLESTALLLTGNVKLVLLPVVRFE